MHTFSQIAQTDPNSLAERANDRFVRLVHKVMHLFGAVPAAPDADRGPTPNVQVDPKTAERLNARIERVLGLSGPRREPAEPPAAGLQAFRGLFHPEPEERLRALNAIRLANAREALPILEGILSIEENPVLRAGIMALCAAWSPQERSGGEP